MLCNRVLSTRWCFVVAAVSMLLMVAAIVGTVWLHGARVQAYPDRANVTVSARTAHVKALKAATSVTVQWTDRSGKAHLGELVLADPAGYMPVAESYVVRYDPDHPDRAYLAETGQALFDSDQDDVVFVAEILLVGVGVWVVGWLVRARRLLVVRRQAGRGGTTSMRMLPAVGRIVVNGVHGGTVQRSFLLLGPAAGAPAQPAWMRPADQDAAKSFAADVFGDGMLMRVMYEPALDQVREPVTVQVHGPVGLRKRVVVELADGTLLKPLSRLHPWHAWYMSLPELDERSRTLRTALLPPWYRVLVAGGLGAVIGLEGVIGGVVTAVAFNAAFWVWCGAHPDVRLAWLPKAMRPVPVQAAVSL